MDFANSFDLSSPRPSLAGHLSKLRDIVREAKKDLGPKEGSAITAHPFGQANVRQIREEMAGAVGGMRSILTDHRDKIVASAGGGGMGGANSLRNLLSSLRVCDEFVLPSFPWCPPPSS